MKLFSANNLQQLKCRAGAQTRPDIPSKVYLDLTQDCNMYCVMCRESRGKRGRIMPVELFKRIVDETCAGVTSYSLFNWGEPLYLKDFRQRLAYLSGRKKAGALVDISTNGMLLSDETSRFLLDQDVEVTVSFDGAGAKTFESIRRGGDFKKICANLERLAALAMNMNPYRSPGIYISIQRDNWRELVPIVKTALNLGVKRVGMGPVVGPPEYRAQLCDDLFETVADAINFAEHSGMVADIFPTKLGNRVWEGGRYVDAGNFYVDCNCDAPLTCTSIAWNGDVYLCCNVGEFVENITDKSFADVWLGESYGKLRESVNNPETMSGMCRTCPWVNRY